MNSRRYILVLALAFAWSGRAQEEESQTVSGFRVPEYDEQNRLKSELYGDFAKVLPDGIIEISQLKIDFYSGDRVDMTVTSPYCKYDQKQARAESESDVRITREKMIVTGVGFSWDGREEKLKIGKQVKVVLKEAQKRLETSEEESGAEE
ncbi:MAG: LPS export ABC transporter periplasmic protein LptC [Verrucomicrobiota bacterium]